MPLPPQTLQGGWTRAGLEYPPLDQAPEALRALQPRQWLRTSYKRPFAGSAILVDGYSMASEASALEAQQRWKNEPGTVAFHRGSVFVILSSPTDSTQSLVDFSRRIEQEWLSPAR